jgi:hypothetical protein
MFIYIISGVKTVDDLLERIDEAIEKAKIVVNNGKDPIPVNKNEEPKAAAPATPAAAATPAANDAEKKPEEEEPIRITYGDIHKIEDLLALVNNQPGHRKVELEGAPGQSTTVDVKQTKNPPPATASPGATDEDKDASPTPKTTENPPSTTTTKKTETPSATIVEKKDETPSSATTEKKTETPSATIVEKTDETPSSATTAKTVETPSSTTTAKKTETPSSTTTTAKTTEKPAPSNDGSAPQVDQIHVNIENVQSVDDLLDRIDDAVQKAPVVIDTKPHGLFIIIE